MLNLLNSLTDAQRNAVGKASAISIILLFLLIKSLTLALIACFCLYTSTLAKRGLFHKLVLAALPVAFSFILGWVAATVVYSYQSFGANIWGGPGPQALVWQSWFESPFKPLNNPANKAGRCGVVVGVAASAFLAKLYRRRTVWHGPGFIRGETVVQGGWADLEHIADKCDFGPPKDGAGGVPLGRLKGQLVRVNPLKGIIKMAGHLFAVGAPGTGKSYTLIRMLIIAAVCDAESVVISDPKGELFYDMACWLRIKGYDVIPFNVVNPSYSYWWNMVEECRTYDEIIDLADWLIAAAGDDHAFFSGGEKNVLSAAFAYAKFVMSEGLRHPTAALSILSWPQDFLDGCFDKAFNLNVISNEVYETWKGVQGKYTNYIEGVRNKLRDITKGPLAALTSQSDFSLDVVGKKKTAIFLILPTENTELKSLLVPFYGFMFKRLNELAASAPRGRLPVGVRFILDELGNIGRIPGLDEVVTLGRSKGIMVQMTVQNIAQIKTLYAKQWESIAGNCPLKMCLAVDDIASARYFASLAGGAQVKHVTESRDVSNPLVMLKLPRKKEGTKDVPVLKDYELLQLPEKDCVALLRGKRPLYLEKVAWTELPQYKEIISAGTSTPEEWMLARPLTVQKPPYPVVDDHNYPEPERSRSPRSIKAVKASPKYNAVSLDPLQEPESIDERILSEYF